MGTIINNIASMLSMLVGLEEEFLYIEINNKQIPGIAASRRNKRYNKLANTYCRSMWNPANNNENLISLLFIMFKETHTMPRLMPWLNSDDAMIKIIDWYVNINISIKNKSNYKNNHIY